MLSVQKMPVLLKKTDWLLILLLIAGAFIWLLCSKGTPGSQAVVRIDGQTVQTLPLSTDGQYVFAHNGVNLTITIQNGAAAITDSSCPDRLCVNTGALTTAGQTAVCLPAALSVTVEDAHRSAPDAITY